MVRQSPSLRGGATWIGHGPTPVAWDSHFPPENGLSGRPTQMPSGQNAIEDFPPGFDDEMSKMRWRNYHDRGTPKLFPSVEENQKMWQEIEVDRMMDYHPPHEIHANNLPDYHYWPMIQNDIDPAREYDSPMTPQYNIDQTQIPRFHRNGVPKTPTQEQLWYIPKLPDGRMDWKKNAMVNSRQLHAYCSESGWDARYLRRIFRPWLAGRQRSKQAGVYTPIYFRHKELPVETRMFRWLKGSYISTGFFYVPFYCAMLAYVGSDKGDYYGHYYIKDGPWNPDYTHLAYLARDKGCYHALI